MLKSNNTEIKKVNEEYNIEYETCPVVKIGRLVIKNIGILLWNINIR